MPRIAWRFASRRVPRSLLGPHLTSAPMATRERVLRPGRPRPIGVQLFASAQDEPRARRPTDVVLAIAAVLVVLLAAVTDQLTPALQAATSNLIAAVPDFLDVCWKLAVWVPLAWAATLLVAAALRRRWALVRDLLLASVVGVLAAAV